MHVLTKFITIVSALATVVALVACDGNGSTSPDSVEYSSDSKVECSDSNDDASSSSAVSSSGINSLSSSQVLSSSSDKTGAKFEYGSLVDSRDNHSYKTIKVGSQTWMAENLNFAPDSAEYVGIDKPSWCYLDNADSCAKYGRLYTWASAIDSVGTFSKIAEGCGIGVACSTLNSTTVARGLCPDNWHLPNVYEWMTLLESVATSVDGGAFYGAGMALKSNTGWNVDGNGADTYGFSVLPAGLNSGKLNFENVGDYGYFWTATEIDVDNSVFIAFLGNESNVYTSTMYKDRAFSIRCIKD